MGIRILLAEDQPITREGLKSLIEKKGGMEVIGEAGNGRDAVRMALKLNPDVVVMDINMPELNGMEATRQLAEQAPEIRVVVLSMHSDRRYVSGMFKAGAMGYILKSSVFEDLCQAIETVYEKRHYFCSSVAGVIMKDYVSSLSSDEEPLPARLTGREREILQMIADGFKTDEIAERLHVSAKTVSTHRRRIMEKLDIHTVAELTKFAVREGITTL